jgi:hypothetical protein
MENLSKEMIKSINDGDMNKTKENFEQMIANKIYDKLEDKKIELSNSIFNKEPSHEEPKQTTEPVSEPEVASAEE